MRMDGAIFSVTYNCIEWACRIVVVRHNVSIIGTMGAIESVGGGSKVTDRPIDITSFCKIYVYLVVHH